MSGHGSEGAFRPAERYRGRHEVTGSLTRCECDLPGVAGTTGSSVVSSANMLMSGADRDADML